MKRYYEIVVMLITWFALILQLIILQDTLGNFFSYFTILSNLLVATSLTVTIFAPETKIGKIVTLPTTKSAIALYILIVGLVYNLVLRGIWVPKGWQLVVDNLLHVIVPILYVLYWLIFIPKGMLKWKDGIVWAYFPLAYLIYSLIRGYFIGWYPYPFLDVSKIGYQKVFINSSFMVIAFVLVALLLIGISKSFKKKDAFL